MPDRKSNLIPHSRRPMSDGRTLPFLYKLSWGLEVALRDFFVKCTLSSEYGLHYSPSNLCSLLDPPPPCRCGLWLSKGVAFLPME